jgi:hypothetical protein
MGSGGTQKQETVPWGPTQQFYKDIYGTASQLSGVPTRFPDQTVAARQPAEGQASEMIQGRALQGSPELMAGREAVRGTAAGEYLSPDSNPYLRDTFRASADEVRRAYQTTVIPGMETRFAGAGRGAMVRDPMSGSLRPASGAFGAAEARSQDELAQNLNELATRIFGGAYESERGRQMGAAGMAPSLAGAGYSELGQLRGAGETDRAYEQAILEGQNARFQFAQEEPWMRVERYRDLISQPSFTGTNTRGGGNGAQTASAVTSGVAGLGSLIGALAAFSSRELKNIIGTVEPSDALRRLQALHVLRWTYKGWTAGDALEHVGPMAEDWQEATGLGDGKEITAVDVFGMLLAATQALALRVETLEREKLAAKEAA